jgi:histidine triad (HIT) family protein
MISLARQHLVPYLPPILNHFITFLFRAYYNMSGCVFCKIINNDAKATILYRDEQVTAFRDLHPAAPTHILIVPNKHIESVNSLRPEDEALVGHLFTVAGQLAAQEGIAKDGYRLITNTGANGGQTVFHLHMHLLGGGRMTHMTR